MEVVDLVYLLMKKTFKGVSFGKTLKVAYIYDQRVVDVAVADWILVYEVSTGGAFAELGGNVYLGRGRVTIDVRTNSKERYGKIKSKIKEALKGQTVHFVKTTPTEIDSLVQSQKLLGSYVYRVTVSDASSLSEMQYVSWDEGEKAGWIYLIDDNDLYIFTYPRSCHVAYIVPAITTELSDKMKKLFRFTMDVGVWIFEDLS